MDNRPIGVFDSGLGGLTTVREIMKEMPGEDIIYFGDTGRVPYGNKSRETILRYTKEDISFLLKNNVKLVIAACGTASSVALPYLKNEYSVDLMGVLEPTCEEAVRITRNGRIGVIGTYGTIKSEKYEQIIRSITSDVCVFSKACPLFVPLVENDYSETVAARLIAEDYLLELKTENVDTLILGCTHYPLLSGVISDIMGKEVTLINSGAMAAKKAKKCLTEKNALSDKLVGHNTFYVSDDAEGFVKTGGIFLGEHIKAQVFSAEEFFQ